MQEIVAGWVQQRLMHNFENNALETALNDCTGEKHQSYSYQELFYEVSKVARNIKYFSGERALLLPGDSSFIFSYLACLMVGVTAVPVNLPGVKRLQRVKSNIEHILDDCEPNLIVALSATKGEIEKFGWDINREVVYLDELFGEEQPLCWNDLCPPTGPVMLQYSSGSTGSPKAVCNYDKNIYHQFDIMLQVEPSLQHIHTANWLPFYHVLGLFYGLMFPLLSGGTCSFIRPSQFSVEPEKWLNMIEQYQATIIAAPDFAYQLCVDSISDLQASELDLSSLKVVMNAAEPIQQHSSAIEDSSTALQRIKEGDGAPIIILHDGSGTVMPCLALVEHLTAPVYGISVQDRQQYLTIPSEHLIVELADQYKALLEDNFDLSKCHLFGFCMGGLIAFELARQAMEYGSPFASLTIASSYQIPYKVNDPMMTDVALAKELNVPNPWSGIDLLQLEQTYLALLATKPNQINIEDVVAKAKQLGFDELSLNYASYAKANEAQRIANFQTVLDIQSNQQMVKVGDISQLYPVFHHSLQAVTHYEPSFYSGDFTFACQQDETYLLPALKADMHDFWQQYSIGDIDVISLEGDHFTCMQSSQVLPLAKHLNTVAMQGGKHE